MKLFIAMCLFLIGCSNSDRAIIVNAPDPGWINKMETFCKSANSKVKDRTITALTHHAFKCMGSVFFRDDYSCVGYKLQYRVICENGATQKLTYSFGNSSDMILDVEDKKEIEKLSQEKDSL